MNRPLRALTRVTWRNLWRNKRRTLITCLSIVCYTAVLIILVTLTAGFNASTRHNITHVTHGDARVHAPGFLDNQSMYKALDGPENILKAAAERGVDGAARSLGIGLVSAGNKSAGGSFVGVDPGQEKKVFELHQEVALGEYLGEVPRGEVVLGSRLARSLKAEVGAELIAVVQAADGSMGNELFRVKGILRAVAADIDRGSIFLHRKDFDSLFMAGGRVHEIAFNSYGALTAEEVVAKLQSVSPTDEWRSWKELVPATAEALKLNEGAFVIFGIVFSLAAALGTMNTMLMATHDRVREFGVIRALGASPWRIVRDVTYEAFILGLLGCVLGGALGSAGSYYLEVVGLDLKPYTEGNLEFGGVSMDLVWKAHLTTSAVVNSGVMIWIICVVTSLYPAVKSARLNPAMAMNHV